MPVHDTLTDEEIVRRVAESDQTAIGDLYDRYRRVVFALALRVLRDRGEAEEVLVDVFLQVWRTASRYDSGRGSVSAWLMTLARTRAIDRLRARPRAATTTLEPETDTRAAAGATGPEEAMEQVLRRRRVTEALATLNEPQRRAIAMAYFGGFSHAEIASSLGEPLGTIKSRIRHGLMALRDSLAAQFASGEDPS